MLDGQLKHAVNSGDRAQEYAFLIVTTLGSLLLILIEAFKWLLGSYALALLPALAVGLPTIVCIVSRYVSGPLVVRRVLVVLPTRWSLPAAMRAVTMLEGSGLEVVFASLAGGEAPVDTASVDGADLEQRNFWILNEEKAAKASLPLGRCPARDFVGARCVLRRTALSPTSTHPGEPSAAGALLMHGEGAPTEFAAPLLAAALAALIEGGGVLGAVGLGASALAHLKPSADGGRPLVDGRQVAGVAGASDGARSTQAALRKAGACIHHAADDGCATPLRPSPRRKPPLVRARAFSASLRTPSLRPLAAQV